MTGDVLRCPACRAPGYKRPEDHPGCPGPPPLADDVAFEVTMLKSGQVLCRAMDGTTPEEVADTLISFAGAMRMGRGHAAHY